jgi:hypothetical protein
MVAFNRHSGLLDLCFQEFRLTVVAVEEAAERVVDSFYC